MSIGNSILFGAMGSALACFLIFIMSLFLILLVLVQRGRGGGLSGAFGGMGGQSAFGARAGDTFTKVTVIAATIWIVLCILCAKFVGNTEKSKFAEAAGDAPREVTIDLPAGATGAPGTPAPTTTGAAAVPAGTASPAGTTPGAEATSTDFSESDIPDAAPAE